ncbi:MAG TPA: hypothetical protein VK034_20310 [Enhygromyxa sp.]|nr:hypothetical protein [Enhygromyxa sp.]
MNKRIQFSFMLVVCGSLAACDVSEDLGDSADLQLEEVTQVAAVAVWPPEVASETELELAVVTEADELEVSIAADPYSIVHKVKKPRPEHLIGWTRWAVSQPYDDGAIADPTGEKCAMGQQGRFWYLAGTFGGPVERECSIPVGKTLVFPLKNNWCVFPSEYYPDQASIDAALPGLEAWSDFVRSETCELTLRIDGHEVRSSLEELDEDFYIKVFEPFEINLHEEHWAPDYFAGSVMPATGFGHYAVVKPLPPGDHVIELGGKRCGNYPFDTYAKYLLHIGN